MAIANQFSELTKDDGSWDAFLENWRTQCGEFDEEIENFASATLRELGELATEGHPRAGVYGLQDGDDFVAVCQANCVPLPDYDGPVLRLRFLTVSPRFDFGDFEVEQYATLLVRVLVAALVLSDDEHEAKHIKFHLKSPADRAFFAALGSHLNDEDEFESVKMIGSWLYITKN